MRVRPVRPRTAAAPGPQPHRSWSSIAAAAAGPRTRSPPRWRPERRGPRHPQHSPTSPAHLVAKQLPHVHRTHRAPPPGTCRKPPGACDTCRKAGSAGRVAGRHTAGKRGEEAVPKRERRETPHCRKAARGCRERLRGHRGCPRPSRVPRLGSGASRLSPGATCHRAGRERDPDVPRRQEGPPCPEQPVPRRARPGCAPWGATPGRAPWALPSASGNQRLMGHVFHNLAKALPAVIDNTFLFIPSVINRCHLENTPITGPWARQQRRDGPSACCGRDKSLCNSTRCRTPDRLRHFSI